MVVVVVVVEVVVVVVVGKVVVVVVVGKVVEIDCEKPMKLETSPKVTKSNRSLHWCRSISKKYLCRFYYSISQTVITLSGRRFITESGGFITLSGSYYIIGRFFITLSGVFLLHYRAHITVSGVYYIIGWYTGDSFVTFTRLPENL